jgi:hypothetical protein
LIADSSASTSDDFKYKSARNNSQKDGLQSASRFLGLAYVFACLGFVLIVSILLLAAAMLAVAALCQSAAAPRTVLRAIATRITLVSRKPSH